MSRLIVGPFNRVEGDLEVRIECADGAVTNAEVVTPLYRGFERILVGKAPMDALVYAPRICGICSVSQSVAAAKALASTMDVSMPHNGELAINLIHATENVADHLTHFYLFFMPDFARETYRGEPWFEETAQRFVALKGEASEDVLPARAQFMHVMGVLAGKWPHTLSIQPGGSTRSIDGAEIARLTAILASFRKFLERTLFGDRLERIGGLESEEALLSWYAERHANSSDFRRFLTISKDLGLEALGRSTGSYVSFGGYCHQGTTHFRRGTFQAGNAGFLDPRLITEDVTSSWYQSKDVVTEPHMGSTIPDADREGAYTWCKAPRLDGSVMEVGALARQLVDGHPLIRDLERLHGGSVHTRIVARLLEVALVVMAMEHWVNAFVKGDRFIAHGDLPKDADGLGLTEAARGALGHWLSIRDGQIANYQIIAPTTWNFSPRDNNGVSGPLEQALVGSPVRPGEQDPVSVQHIVRSFDPCMVCTVH